MKNLLVIIVVVALTVIMIPIATCDTIAPTDSEIDFSWNRVFGQAVMDWVVEPDTNNIKIEVAWSAAVWGLGAEILLEEPINLKDVARIEVLVHTNHNSPTKIYAIVATPDDANLSFPPTLAYPVTSVPSKFTFPVDKLVRYKPDSNSRNFRQDDWQRIDRIKFILTKPTTSVQDLESIIISKPQIIYREISDTETRSEEPMLDEATKPPKIAKIPDAEDPAHDTDEIVISEDIQKSEITHFQSLEELMAQYPSDDSSRIEAEIDNNTPVKKLILYQISTYEDCVQDWGAMDDENKFFFDVNWKNDQSGFAMNFGMVDFIEASGEWHLIFTAQALDRSDPRISIVAYYDNEYDPPTFSYDNDMILKDRWITFHIPLTQETVKSGSADKVANRMINRIKIVCSNKNSSLNKEDVIIIKDLQLIKKSEVTKLKVL